MKKYIYIFLLILMNACKSEGQNHKLSGKIVVCELPSTEGKCYIINDDVKKEFFLPKTKEREYDLQSWLNKKDVLIGIERNKSQSRKTTHSNLVLLDTLGNIIERLIETEEGQYIGLAYPSSNDSLLLFTTEVETKEMGALELFNRPVSINVINFKSRAIIKQMPNICSNINFDIHESPWSPDEDKFVYSIRSDRKVVEAGKSGMIYLQPEDGVYIYNIKQDSFTRIAEKGFYAVWSPKGDNIAFLNDNKIWLYKTLSKSIELLYVAEKQEQLKIIHWTPDGDYLYVICPKYGGNNFNMQHNEKLIRVKDREEVSFVKPNIGLNVFTWK